MALHLQHRLDPRFRSKSKPQPPASHRVSLREGSANHHLRAQRLRQLARGERLCRWIREIQITLMADYPDAALSRHFDDFFEVIRWNDPSGGIVGGVDDQQAGARSNRIAYSASCEQKAVWFSVDHHGPRANELRYFWKRHPVRRRDQNFFSWIQKSGHRIEDSLFAADGYQHF